MSPTILEAAKILSKVASQGVSKVKSTDKGKRYRRRARSVAKIINTGLDAEEEINTSIEEVSIGSAKVDFGTASKRGQREGKALMVEEDIQATHKTKEQVREEEVGLEEAIKLQAQMIAKRMAEEEELSKQQKKRKAEVQEAAQNYTEEDWDTIRAKLEANAELTKSLQGESMTGEDFAKRMIDIEDASITKGKDEVVKEEETKVPVKKTGMRRKQKARKGINIDKTAQDEFNKEREAYMKDKVKDASSESEIGVYIIRKDDSDKIYMSFGAMLKDFSRDELVELYRLVIKKYGANTPEEMYDRVLWGDLKTMFDPPLSDDAI
ncbi:hypothetical protein Tco_0642061 [Tanacetum coccineum]